MGKILSRSEEKWKKLYKHSTKLELISMAFLFDLPHSLTTSQGVLSYLFRAVVSALFSTRSATTSLCPVCSPIKVTAIEMKMSINRLTNLQPQLCVVECRRLSSLHWHQLYYQSTIWPNSWNLFQKVIQPNLMTSRIVMNHHYYHILQPNEWAELCVDFVNSLQLHFQAEPVPPSLHLFTVDEKWFK